MATLAQRQWCDGSFALGGSDAREKEIESKGEWEGRRHGLQAVASGQQRQAIHGAWWPCGGRCLSPVGTVPSSNFQHSVADQLTDCAFSSPPNSKTVAS